MRLEILASFSDSMHSPLSITTWFKSSTMNANSGKALARATDECPILPHTFQIELAIKVDLRRWEGTYINYKGFTKTRPVEPSDKMLKITFRAASKGFHDTSKQLVEF